MMKCIVCGSKNIETRDTVISDFVMARIDPEFEITGKNKETKLCFCTDCMFAFYEYRFSEEEEARLYNDYRGENYQKTREKYECWYTEKVNNAINVENAEKQQRIIKKVLGKRSFQNALDYGGNQGSTFYAELGTESKTVYDISGVQTLPGVRGVNSLDELRRCAYDFIMCNMVLEHVPFPYDIMKTLYQLGRQNTVYYMEVPSENPFTQGNKFSVFKNLSLLTDRNYSWYRLAKYYFQQRKQPFMPMKEHINFFTPKSIQSLAENSGFTVLDIQENPLDNSTVLSMVFKKR